MDCSVSNSQKVETEKKKKNTNKTQIIYPLLNRAAPLMKLQPIHNVPASFRCSILLITLLYSVFLTCVRPNHLSLASCLLNLLKESELIIWGIKHANVNQNEAAFYPSYM